MNNTKYLILKIRTRGFKMEKHYSQDCTNTSIGVENKYIIPDSSFTASSASSASYPFGLPFNGRLNASFGWAPKTTTNPNDYLQVDLGFPYVICAVTTQGRGNGEEWVTEYKVSLSMNDKNWMPYQENGIDKIFTGNTDQNSYVKNSIIRTRARYIRLYPTKYNGYKVMRVGIFGFKKGIIFF
ncbi:contactin-associated protein-like 5 [Actinia tenebrosa]|uniref:Contactin-associated protein-like 5 n=1 Tax=Actinia tenebrosa TaxID=6105 RepID=A0A6P8HC74_ACTTE|nr:contactin-associated protein-like 5 [Actinia tenebrosa]